MSSDTILERLKALHPKVIDLSLDRIAGLLARLDHPERRLAPVVHVAGTNGKGSLIAFLRAMLGAAGYRVQAYTSPHLVRFAERIRLSDGVIAEDRLAALLVDCERRNGGRPITYFEITTAAAFLAFAADPADILLLEVGLGGRLDATNVIAHPALVAITPVSLDHQFYLGDTLAKIAAEKAGILKPGVPAVIGPQPAAAAHAIARRARSLGVAPLRHRRTGQGVGWSARQVGERLIVHVNDETFTLPLPALPGPHQLDNAGMAVACARVLPGFTIGRAGLAEGVRRARWTARLQRLAAGPLPALLPAGSELWLDGGHNPAAGAALARWQQERGGALTLIVGMLASKDSGSFVKPLAAVVSAAYTLAIPGEPASRSAEEMATLCRAHGIAAQPAAGIAEALRSIAAGGRAAAVLIAGSLYLAGRVLALNGMVLAE